MFKVIASNLDEYFTFDPLREGDLRSMDRTIRQSAPSFKRWFVTGTPEGEPGMKMSMIGYGQFTYTVQNSSRPIPWPIVGLALQKNYISFYCAAKRKDTPFTLEQKNDLGDISVSKMGVINFRSADDFNLPELSKMLQKLEADLKKGALTVGYSRVKAKSR